MEKVSLPHALFITETSDQLSKTNGLSFSSSILLPSPSCPLFKMLPVLSDFILLAGGYEDHFNEKKLDEYAIKANQGSALATLARIATGCLMVSKSALLKQRRRCTHKVEH